VRIFISTLATETNSFSPIPSGAAAFKTREYFRGDGSTSPPLLGNIPLIEWRRLAQRDGHEIAESISSFATPAGVTQRAAYEELRTSILDDLRAASPVNAVLLFLHGAMIADGYDDCEGDVIAHVREIVGADVPIGVEIDLHCHLTELMRVSADVIVAFKEYPHTDIPERAGEVYTITMATAHREVRPVMALHDCRMISVWRPTVEPMKSFVARMKSLERDGILSISFGHGFPWGDVPDVGAKILVVADRDRSRAEALAAQLGQEVWEMRHAAAPRHDSIDEAIDKAVANRGRLPVVIADVGDNAGAGAPSDNTEILHRIVQRKIRDVATGCYWDPVAVQFCIEAGIGSTFDLRIGGKCGIASGSPLDLSVTVRNIATDHHQTGLGAGRSLFGPSAWVSVDGIDIILTTLRQQTHSPDAFTNLGCNLEDKRIVVVKSMQHFYDRFSPLADDVRYAATSGAIDMDFARLPYRRKNTPYWPKYEDPFDQRISG
jgi:microcystin degradation protein MlrC